jgi:two-component system, sensor histidine kinase and response regulator
MNQTLNYDAALKSVEGDQELLAELVGLFLEDCPKQMAALQQAVEIHDRKSIERIAHSLKGAIGSFAARPAYDALLRLEELGRQDDFAGTRQACLDLENEIARLTAALSSLARAQG